MENQKEEDRCFKCDFLYIGDAFDDTVKTFDPETGKFLGTFVPPNSGNLHGPRGLIINHKGNLVVSNQKVGQPENGDVLKFIGQTGALLGELVRSAEPGSPLAPRGIVLSNNNVLFVADIGDFFIKDDVPVDVPGAVRKYNGTSGVFLGNLNHSGFSPFHPRGLVFGPDGLLYVSVVDLSDPNKGWVLRFNLKSGGYDLFIVSDNKNNLHRPEGLVFGPDGNLYVTSFKNLDDPNDTDKILIFDGKTGKFLDKIDLYAPGKPRAFAQALLFGPDGKLFVPITGPFDNVTGAPTGKFTGSVRRYNVHTKKFKEIVLPYKKCGPLGVPWYLTFGKTNPKTLVYQHDRDDTC
ncbi:hypothetical protein BGM26_04335 [Bacillus sp. FJAT-29790]|uniref:Vgb family protein n=1 Tax=Bacillus sp. FJAT-29790 TaxID=1895002 RepID=UPI001C24DDE7|nr:hypothetical protein [Bacillus sp. FJAT-29790]MBU8878220.1 hypothetical protein [Bacillus sp. FJAT-29790]